MTDKNFDPRNVNLNDNLTDEQRLIAVQQEEARVEAERVANENIARGLNPDGSQKAPTSNRVGGAAKRTPAIDLEATRAQKIDGLRDAPANQTSLSEEHLQLKAKLAGQAKLPIFLPLESGEVKGVAYRPVIINGYRFEVKKGVMVMVPQAVHSLLINAMQATSEATEVEENLSNVTGQKARALGLE